MNRWPTRKDRYKVQLEIIRMKEKRLKEESLSLVMPHPPDDKLYPKGSKAIWTRPSHRIQPKVVEVTIIDHSFQSFGRGFLNYNVEIKGEPGKLYAAYHDDLKLK